MTYIHQSDCDGLRVILCLEFTPHAEPEAVSALKSAIVDCSNTLHSVEVTGDFDFMTELAPPDRTGLPPPGPRRPRPPPPERVQSPDRSRTSTD